METEKVYLNKKGEIMMERNCSECGKEINESTSDNLDLVFQKVGYVGDLCKECWDREWELAKEMARKVRSRG